MKRYAQILLKYQETPGLLGAKRVTGAPVLSDAARANLIAELKALNRRNDRLVWVIVVLLVFLFLVSIWVVVAHLDQPKTAAAAGAGLGVSAAGCIVWLLQVWREKTAIEPLLLLAASLGGEALSTVISVLAKRATTSLPRSSGGPAATP
jgi:hypothetical protein